MAVNLGNVTRRLLASLVRDQERRAKRETKLPFAAKLKIADQLMADGVPKMGR